MREEDYKAAEAVRLETLADVNDLGKPWRYEEDGAHRDAHLPVVAPRVPSRGMRPQALCERRGPLGQRSRETRTIRSRRDVCARGASR